MSDYKWTWYALMDDYEQCLRCNGKGYTSHEIVIPSIFGRKVLTTKDTCWHCLGVGYIKKGKAYEVPQSDDSR
jgi:DnaJ-class molecular chaperone